MTVAPVIADSQPMVGVSEAVGSASQSMFVTMTDN